MRTKKHLIFWTLVFVVGLAGSLNAAPIPTENTRPVAIGPSVAPEPTLQSLLDSMWGVGTFDAIADQDTAAVFQTVGEVPYALNVPLLAFEFSGNSSTHVFGLWSGTDSTALTHIPVFTGVAAPGSFAVVQWTGANTLQIFGGPGVNSGVFAGIDKNFFGFYYAVDPTAPPLYTVDALNPGGQAAALAYNYNNIAWTFAFDDISVDFDYNDLVVKVESIAPVPLPASLILLGSGLCGMIGLRRRR